MSFVVSQGPPVYNPQTWHYTQEYRQRFKLDRPSPSQSTQQTRAVKFGGRVLEPSPANLPWPRTPALKPATNDNWGIHQAPTEPNTPVGSRSSSPVPEIGEPVTPAMLLPRPSDENAEVPIPLRRSRRPRKEKTPPAEDAQGLKWPISVHKWLNQLMETCTDNEQRRILGNGLDPLMEQYAAYIRMEGLEQPAPSASAMAGPSTLPHMRDIEEETEVESLVLGSDRMEDTRSGEENPNEAFHDVLSSVLVAVIPSSGKHPTSSASKGKRRLDDKDGPQEPVDGESDPASPHAKKIRMSVDVESRRYQKASVAEQKGVAPSPQSSFHGPTQVSVRDSPFKIYLVTNVIHSFATLLHPHLAPDPHKVHLPPVLLPIVLTRLIPCSHLNPSQKPLCPLHL